MKTIIYNGLILLPDSGWTEGRVVADDGVITNAGHGCSMIERNADVAIDACGGYVMPGGIDLHVHGGGGHDFMEGTVEAFEAAIMTHRRHGTTSMYPTLAAAPEEMIRRAAEVTTLLMADKNSGVLGLHLEGPYFEPTMAGGQPAGYIRRPNADEYRSLVEDYACIKRWDAAPEIEGADKFGRYMRDNGIVASIAHTKADCRGVEEAWRNGYSHATHFYNGMTAIHKEGIFKHDGTVEGVYLADEMTVEVIADGIHVPTTVLRLIHKMKGTERMCLVTDSMSYTDAPGGCSTDDRIMISDGVCVLRDRSAVAGSCATMDRLIRTAAIDARIPLAEVSRMVSEIPARIMGVYDRKGSIERGKDADLIVMDKDLRLTHVVAMGRPV